jgi:hypothetical protein
VIRTTSKLLIELVGVILAGLVVLGGLAAWRLASGPIAVNFLTPLIEQGLNDAANGVSIDIGDTVLTWNGLGEAFDIRARRVRAFGAGPLPIASVPELGIGLDPRALIWGRVRPTRLNLVRPQLRLVRAADGSFNLDIRNDDQTDTTEGEVNAAALLLEALRQPPGSGSGPLAALTEVQVTGAALNVDDRQHGGSWQASRADIRLVRDVAGIRGTVRLDVDLGQHTAQLSARLVHSRTDGVTDVSARFENLAPADLAERVPDLKALAAVSVAVAGTADLRLDRGFNPTHAQLQFTGHNAVVTLPDLFGPPLPVPFIEFRGSFDAEQRLLAIDEFSADLGGPTLKLSGSVKDLGEGRLDIQAETVARDVPVDALDRLWPRGMAPNPRGWITQNLSAGRVDEARANARAVVPLSHPEAAEVKAMTGEIRFRGVDIRYFHELPRVRGVAGTAHFTHETMTLDLAGGQLKDMKVGESRVVITGLDKPDQAIDIAVPVSGPLRTALDVLNQPPLGYPAKLGLDPAAVGGTASARLTFKFPLENSITVDDVVFGATGRLTGGSVNGLIGELPVTKGELDLSLDPQKLKLEGKAQVNGIPATVAWQENFSRRAEFLTRISAQGEVGDLDRERLGLGTAPYVRGPLGVNAVYTVAKPGQGRLATTLDLKNAAAEVPALAWRKPVGTPGTAKFVAEFVKGDPVRLSDIRIDTGNLKAAGQVDLVKGGIGRIRANDLTLGETHVEVDARPLPGGGYRIRLDGPTLDARPMLQDDDQPGAAKPENRPPLDLDLRIGRLLVGEGEALHDVNGSVRRDRTAWTEASLDARIGGHAPVKLRYGPEGKLRRLDLEADDAGALFRAFDLFDNVRGGRLSVIGRTDPAKPGDVLAGRVEMTDYSMADAPILARLLNAASPWGLADLLGGKGIEFTRLDGEFRWEDEPEKLWLANLRTSGSALGLTLEGLVDIGAERLDLQGTIVPISGINRLLGAIPLLGKLLTGGEGQGVFSATYKIAGPLKDPDITVNPLAVLAPGFLRNLFFMNPEPGEGTKNSPRVYEYPDPD